MGGNLAWDLLLRTTQFKQGVDESKQKLDELKNKSKETSGALDRTGGSFKNTGKAGQILEKAFGSIGGSLKGFIGKLGAAGTAVSVLHGVMTSSTTSVETMNDVIGTSEKVVDNLYTAINRGDWSVFEDGITNAIKLAGDYNKAIRDILKIGLFGDIRMQFAEDELESYENKALNKNASTEEREQGRKEYNAAYSEEVTRTNASIKAAYDAITKMLGADDIKIDDAKQFKTDLINHLDPSQAEHQSLMAYVKDFNDHSGVLGEMKYGKQQSKDYINMLKQNYPDMENFRKVYEKYGSVEGAQELIDKLDVVIKALEHLHRIDKQYNDLQQEDLTSENKKKEPKKTKPKKTDPKATEPELPLIVDDEIIKWAEKEADNIYNKLNETLNEKFNTPFELTPIPEVSEEEAPEEEEVFNKRLRRKNIKSLGNMYDELDEKRHQLFYLDPKLYPNATKQLKKDIEDLTEDISRKEIKIEFKDWKSDLADLSDGITGVMANADFSSKEGRQAVANETIQSIKALIVAKAIESAMMLPFPANIIAAPIAAAAVAGLFSLIPAFEQGGIFESPLTSGDRNIARLNGGEMILNKGQQYNLFKLLDNGGSLGSNQGQIQFKLRGSDIYGSLSNYNKKMSKVR